MKAILNSLLFVFVIFGHSVLCAQDTKKAAKEKGPEYTMRMLVQDPLRFTKSLDVSTIKEVYAKTKAERDTTFTLYNSTSAKVMVYFVHGEEYHHILNPNPTGVSINGKIFNFYCAIEMGSRTNISNFLDVFEFSYLSRKYLCFFSYREDCIQSGCRYRCYNLYDITDPESPLAYSFSSIYGGYDSFGDYNFDGIIDFVRAAPKHPENAAKLPKEEQAQLDKYALITAYTFKEGTMTQLSEKGNAYYLFVKSSDEEMSKFRILEADWFMPVKDTTGNVAPKKPYFAPYISFDPKNPFLYDANGYRVEKRRFALHMRDYQELDGALDYCEELKKDGFKDVFVLADQYNRELTFMVLVGNYWAKEKAQEELKKAKGNNPEALIINIEKEFWVPEKQ